jgi:hypothetical protein
VVCCTNKNLATLPYLDAPDPALPPPLFFVLGSVLDWDCERGGEKAEGCVNVVGCVVVENVAKLSTLLWMATISA